MDIMSILNANKSKNFVKRILNPEKKINLEGGQEATHLMMSSDNIVYPTIIENKDGELIQLTPEKAYKYAIENDEFIKFKTEDEAKWFGKNYKNIWKY